jgi:hypothetical protein
MSHLVVSSTQVLPLRPTMMEESHTVPYRCLLANSAAHSHMLSTAAGWKKRSIKSWALRDMIILYFSPVVIYG